MESRLAKFCRFDVRNSHNSELMLALKLKVIPVRSLLPKMVQCRGLFG